MSGQNTTSLNYNHNVELLRGMSRGDGRVSQFCLIVSKNFIQLVFVEEINGHFFPKIPICLSQNFQKNVTYYNYEKSLSLLALSNFSFRNFGVQKHNFYEKL